MRDRVRTLKRDGVALLIAAWDPRTPLLAKLVIIAIVAYVLSPIDLIPDFIPILGLLDELILVPAAIGFALRLVPDAVMNEARARAPDAWLRARRVGLIGAGFVVLVWVVLLAFFVLAIYMLYAGAV